MTTEEIFKQSGYTIPTDKHDECTKRFDYWDMIAFADLVIEKQKEQDSNLALHLVSKRIQKCEIPFSLKDGKYIDLSGNEITTEELMKNEHEIDGDNGLMYVYLPRVC
jgi:hypothetical protein